jgi:hypothetical protein
MGLHRQPEARQLCQHAAVPCRREADPAGEDPAAAGLHPRDPVAVLDEAGDLASLDQVHTQLVGPPGQRPGDVVVLGDAGAGLEGGTEDRVTGVGGDVEDGADLGDLVRPEPFGVDAVEAVGVDPADAVADVLRGVREVEHAALAEEEVVVQLLREPLPQLERVFVEHSALVPQVVRPDDGGVACHVAAGQPAFLQDGDVGDAVLFGEVVGGGQAVASSADDDDVVRGARLGVAPEEVRMLRQRLSGHAAPPFWWGGRGGPASAVDGFADVCAPS